MSGYKHRLAQKEDTMAKKEKVCLITGAAGTVGQHLVAGLVALGYKVLALGEATDTFAPEILQNRNIRITTALPISAEQFKKHDVQFCFGNISDISFLASVFTAADKGDVDISFLFHLSANELIQKHSPNAYHPDYGDTVNMLEVARAYWQGHKKIFKGFFYAADTGKRAAQQIEKLIKKTCEKDNFPAVIYHAIPVQNIGSGYTGRTALTSLYRFVSPVPAPQLPKSMSWKKEADSELAYIACLKRAAEKVLTQVKEGKTISLD